MHFNLPISRRYGGSLPPGPYDLAECADGPDVPTVTRYQAWCKARPKGTQDPWESEKLDDSPFATLAAARAAFAEAAQWDPENYDYEIEVEEIEIADPDWDGGGDLDVAFETYYDR